MRSNKKVKGTVSEQLFNELAVKNVKKSAKDYFIYFFTLMLSVCLFYSFNSISTQFESLGLVDTLNYLSFASSVLTAFSVIVCFIMGALVVYANRYLLRRRKKEIGVYATLGMERRDLNRLLMKETLQIGTISLIAGLILGIFASQILSLITAKLAGVSLSSYHFLISPKAILLSILFFGILFYVVHLFNVRELRKMSLLELLYADRKNETVSEGHWALDVVFAAISFALIAGGYGALISKEKENIMDGLGLGGMLIIIGTFFFFTVIQRVVIRIMKKNRNFYFSGLNMFTVSQVATKMKTESRSAAMISALLFLSLSLTIVGPGLGKSVINGIENATPYSGSISYISGSEITSDPMEYLNNSDFNINDFSSQYASFHVYESPEITDDFWKAEGTADQEEKKSGIDEDDIVPLDIIGAEDYNRMLALQGIEPIQLGKNEYAVNYTFPSIEKTIKTFEENPGTLRIGDTQLTLAKQGIYHNAWENRNVLADGGTLIIPQYLTEKLTSRRWLLNFNLKEGDDLQSALNSSWLWKAPEGFRLEERQDVLISIAADNLLVTYLGIYLGITFLITSGAVLALQQLSQASDNTKRYGLLRKLGASKKDMRQSLMKQLRQYFAMPLILAVIHSAVVVFTVFREFAGVSLITMLSIIGAGILLVLAVYAVYFVSTYLGSKRILKL